MKISIITICFNNEAEIRATIESVICQTYRDIEYIIKDGGSKDQTVEIASEYAEKYQDKFSGGIRVISCKDKGIYDALNQGIDAATGDVVGFIHAGDRLYEPTTIEKIARFHTENEVDISFGNSQTVNGEGRVVRCNHSPRKPYKLWMDLGWMPSHMSMYAKKTVYEKYGGYRSDMGVAGDYEWFLRNFYKHGKDQKIKCLDTFVLYFSLGGASSKDGINKIQSKQKEMLKDCWMVNGLKPIPGLVYARLYWGARIIIRCKIDKLFGKL